MVGVGVDADFNTGTSGDGHGGSARLQLVAADIVAGDITDEAIVLPVLGLADVSPRYAAVDAGESVLQKKSVEVRLESGNANRHTVSAGQRGDSEDNGGNLHLCRKVSVYAADKERRMKRCDSVSLSTRLPILIPYAMA